MKFGALLRTSAGEVPELQELFTAYKQLKKHLKKLPEKQALAGGSASISPAAAKELGATEADFVATLSADVARFNDMFLEREEDAVIRLRSLEDEGSAAHTAAALKDVYRKLVDFHGEMLLLVHWSILAYTGMVKILKKHHKRTGLLVRAPHLDNLAAQPFCSTELMSELVRKAEADIDALRGRLSMVGAAERGEGAAPSSSAALLQAARDKGSGDSALQLLPGGAVGAAAQQFLAAASDSGSAPSAADGAAEASDGAAEASDGETRAAAAGGAAPADEPCGAPSAAPAEASAGVRSPARVGSKRAAPEGDAAVNSSRRGAPPPALEQPAAARRRMAPPTLDPVAAGAQPAPAAADEGGGDRGGPRGNSSGGASVSALPGGPPAEEGATAGAGAADAPGLADSGAGEEQVPDAAGPQLQQGQQLLQLHLQQHEELRQLAEDGVGEGPEAGSVAGGSPQSMPSDVPPTMLMPPGRSAAAAGAASLTPEVAAAEGHPEAAPPGEPAAVGEAVEGGSPPHRGEAGQPGHHHHLAAVAEQRPPAQHGAPRILAQTQAALGLWKELTETASTPSTVLPVSRRTVLQGGRQGPATSVTTDQSAA